MKNRHFPDKKIPLGVLIFGFLFLPFTFGTLFAQGVDTPQSDNSSRWYIGVDAGTSFGFGTFRSFAADKTRAGYGFGLLGGYPINHYLSLEAEFRYSHLSLGAYDCCKNLWLGADGNRYYAPLAGTDNYRYGDLRSSVNMYQLGLRLNIDLIRLFKPESRWSLLVSPGIYDLCSKATVKTIKDGYNVLSGDSELLFGAGGDLGLGYRINDRTSIRLYTGITGIWGGAMDGLPQTEHTTNYVWNSGFKVTFSL